MVKRELDLSIKGSLNIAASGSFEVKRIDVDKLRESPDNFFEVSRIEELADTILGQGAVKENLIVRELPGGEYEIVSGHRRTAAVRLLLERGESISRHLPCLVQTYTTEEDRMLDLVLMNVSGRRISDDEMFKSYEVLNESLQKLKKDGIHFGQVQKTLADMLGVSTGQVAKMQYIDKHATDEEKEEVRSSEKSLNTTEKAVKEKKPPKPPKVSKESTHVSELEADDKVIIVDNFDDDDDVINVDNFESDADVTNIDDFEGDDEAMANSVADKPATETTEDKLYSKDELANLWSNSEKRRAFPMKYKEWGVFAKTSELNLTYYKYDLPDGSHLIVMEHMQKLNPFSTEWEIGTMNYLQKHEHFMPYSVSDFEIDEHLKKLKGEL